MLNLTADKITKVSIIITGTRAEEIAKSLNDICPLYKIDTPDIFHEFIANVLHESGCFNTLTENLNYQAVALVNLFSRKRISIADCNRYGRVGKQKANQEMIANLIYGGEWGKINLGNTLPGDGYLFRGSGPIQITGRANVTNFTKYYNNLTKSNLTPEHVAELLRSDINLGIHSACWIFAVSKQLIDEAIADNMKDIVKKINGGYLGMPERMKFLERAKLYIN